MQEAMVTDRRSNPTGQNFASLVKTLLSPVFRQYFSYCRIHQ